MRLALLAAFRFPAPQGSQRYADEQARALAAAGADVTLFCYGRGDGRDTGALPLVRSAPWLAPSRPSARLDPRKLPSDAALMTALVRAHRASPFDAVLAHNAEATLLALALRRRLRIPVVYVAHTLWAVELAAHLPRGGWMSRATWAPGAALDRLLARGADATLVLSRAAERALRPFARGPLVRVPPGWTRAPAPQPDEVEDICRRHELAPSGYAIYAGNLDAYQDLGELDAAAERIAPRPVVVATHDSRAVRFRRLRMLRLASPDEARLLVYGARAAIVPRRHVGGFPIKLLQYLEAERAVVARAPLADTLAHRESGWLLAEDASARALGDAIARVWDDAALAARLGAGGRRALEKAHDWPALALDTLEVAREAARRRIVRA
ncbi:MAG TPA: glycosyltransferase [Myxococcota bacterium]|nr:glycosyltransferase [Myxococcota bacterium]